MGISHRGLTLKVPHGGGGYWPSIYGVSWDKSSSPTLTRTDDALGMIAAAGVDSTPVTNDFDTAQIFGDFTEVIDSLGNVFIRIPKFYIKKTDGIGSKTWQISYNQSRLGTGAYLPKCFWDFANSVELPYIDIGKYLGSVSSGKLESKAGTYPQISTNIVDFRTYAQANGTGYQQLDIHVVDLLQTLFYIEFATLDSRAIMAGYTDGRYNASDVAVIGESGTNRIVIAKASADQFVVGQAISIGTSLGGNQVVYGRTIDDIVVYDASNKALEFSGDPVNITIGNIAYSTGWQNDFSDRIEASSGSLVSNSSGKYPCHYRGIESPWGNVWQFVDGININGNQAWVCPDAAQYASNLFVTPYEQLDYVNHNANGWIADTGYDPTVPYAVFPFSVGGSGSTYLSDYYYQAAGQRIALLGGNWGNGTSAGLSCWGLHYTSSFASVVIGARLLKKAL
jgi:hypothetical protein